MGRRVVSRLVVISNRVADPKQTTPTGRLAVGLLGALQQGGGMWFGWNGGLTDGESHDPRVQVRRGVTYATIDLNARL